MLPIGKKGHPNINHPWNLLLLLFYGRKEDFLEQKNVN